MRNPAISPSIVAGLLAVFVCAGPARAQYVSTAVTNLNSPSGVAIDKNANLYIADTQNNRIAIFVPGAGSLATFAGSGAAGDKNGTGTSASFDQPWGIVAVSNGLVVADYGSGLIRLVSYGKVVTTLAGSPFAFLNGPGQGFLNGLGTNASFSFPTGIAADNAGNIYVADSQNNAIRKINTTNYVSTVLVTNYEFNLPTAVAVDLYGNIWVADSGNDVICMISNGSVTVVAGIPGQPGSADSDNATTAQFNNPNGLLYVNQSFLIADSGNDTIRSLYLTNINGVITNAVQTVAGLAGLPGSANGALSVAQFNNPLGLCADPTDFGYYVADSKNNSVRVLQATAPLPAVVAPQIGYVSFPTVGGQPYATFNNITGSSVVFNNTNFIEIQADATSSTYVNSGATGSAIAAPGPGVGFTPTIWTSADVGALPTGIPGTVVPPMSNLTIYAISEVSGRPSSPQVSAQIQYVTATPDIVGNDSASILLTDATTNAQMWYTLDGSIPVQYGANSLGPITSGTILSFIAYSNTTLSVIAYYPAFAPSSIVTNVFTPANFSADKLTFGFQGGEGSSAFIASAGQRFYAPVTLTLIPSGEVMYTLQFDMVVTNLTGPASAEPGTFQPMVVQPVPGDTGFYEPIPAPGYSGPGYTLITNTTIDLLGVAWIERPPETNLYPTPSQTLISYSIAHDTLFTSGGGSVIVGAFSFFVSPTAANGQTYRLDLSNPSATSDGIHTPVLIQTVTNGSLTNGPINSTKVVTVGSFPYLVGDATPFHWFNAGDFGDGVLLDDDVTEVFQSAIYGLNKPPAGSDFFDTMDSCNGNVNNLYAANDTSINTIMFGDGQLNVDDVYVTLRRSLDPTLTNYDRYWSNGMRQAVAVPSTAGPTSLNPLPGKLSVSGPRYVTVAADQVQADGNLTVQVPIRVLAADAIYPIRVAMLNVEIDPLDGSPAITNTVNFTPVTNLGAPYTSASLSVNSYAAAWLNSSNTGVGGTSLIGTLSVTLPPSVNTNSAYLVHFDHFSASPNGVALFNMTIQDGLITVGNRTGSSWHDGIPDTWRLLYFGTVSNMQSAANADPDGDGANNWDEYIAGTNPLNAASVFEFASSAAPTGGYFTLQWPSVVNKTYSVQRSSSPGGAWTTIASNLLGNSQTLQWTDTNANTGARFYRAWVR